MLKISIHMQRVKCNEDIVKVFKKRIKSVARILFEKIIFEVKLFMGGGLKF
jgi:hypothetical protein